MDLETNVPLANHLAFRSTNVEEVHSTIGKYFKSHDIKFLDGNTRLNTILRRTRLNRLAINVLEYGGNVMIDPGALDSFYLLHINLRGQCELTYEKEHLTINTDQAAICTPQRAHRFWWQPESQALAIQIPKERLAAHYTMLTGLPLREDIDFQPCLNFQAPGVQAIKSLLNYLVEDMNNKEGLTANIQTAEMLEHAFLTSLLRLQPSSHQNIVELSNNTIVPAYIRKAEHYMAINLQHALKMGDLAEASGVTDRTLRNGFKRFRGTSPGRFFLSLRLKEARLQLLRADSTQSVSDIAFELGFHHLSNFAAVYKQHFGETPSQTLRQ